MKVRVGIVSYRTPEHLGQCLAALPEALGRHAADTVVVDNASGDASPNIARVAGAQVMVNARNLGYARAMNQALRGAHDEFVIALNPDTVPRPRSLEQLIDHLSVNRDVALVVPRLVNPDGSLQPSVHRFPSATLALVMGLMPMALRKGRVGRHFWLEGFADPDDSQSIDWAIGAVHVLRRSALVDPDQPYDERRFMYGEDMALCWDLHQRGWQVVLDPASEVVHFGAASAIAAFGDTIDQRKLAADYAWYAETHGAARTRLWAAANSIGFGAKAIVAPATWGDDDPRAIRNRRLLRIHAEHLFRRG
ncbi:MAG TPA: glycosyltransferase family 2 protein [Candidatus Limnocylindrales bacterium]|nr:glycosyltransferase family 2 protein [Candidatus Limnocylindrales bacterium]